MEKGSNTYQIDQDNNNSYKLTISKVQDRLKFVCEKINTNKAARYSREYTFNELRSVHPLIRLAHSTDDVKKEIEAAMDDAEYQTTGNQDRLNIIEKGDKCELDFKMMIGVEYTGVKFELDREGFEPHVRCSCPLDDARIDALENDAQDLRNRHEELKRDLGQLASEKEELQRKADEADRLRDENERLQNDLEEEKNKDKDELEKLRYQAQNDQAELSRLRKEKDSDQKEIEDLKEKDIKNTEKIKKLEDENEYLKAEISKLQDELDDLKRKNEAKLRAKVPTRKSVPSKKFNFKGDKKKEPVKGNIIRSPEELELIVRKLKNNGKVSMNLIYKAKVDSDSAQVFHKKCDIAPSTVVLVETKKGNRFGGYTTQSWSGNNEDKFDENAFIFSLDKLRTYDNIKGEEAIGCYPKFGPTFLGCQIKINDNFFRNGGTTYERMLNYETEENYELTNGDRNFDVEDIEVYEIITQ